MRIAAGASVVYRTPRSSSDLSSPEVWLHEGATPATLRGLQPGKSFAMQPTLTTIERIEKLVARKPVAWRRVTRGYTVAERWVAQLQDGSSIFVKHATDANTTDWLRAEYRAYQALRKEFVPELIAWDDAPDPILILEDMSAGFWPPPWSSNHVDRVVRLLDGLAGTTAPQHFPSLAADQASFNGWQELAKDPAGFLGLGLVSAEWLSDALPLLMRAKQTRCSPETRWCMAMSAATTSASTAAELSSLIGTAPQEAIRSSI